MRLTQLKLREVRIPLRFQFSQSNNAGTRQSHSAIVEVHTAGGIAGYGESCPRLYVTGEDMASVHEDMQRLAPGLSGRSFRSVDAIREVVLEWEEAGIGPSTRCALELALLDAWSKEQEQPLDELPGCTLPEELHYSLVLPLLGPSQLERLLPMVKHFTPPSVKLKVDGNLEETIAKVALIRGRFGQELPIRVDVNAGWTLQQAEELIPRLIEQGVTSFEQPLPAGEWEGMAVLTRRFGKEASIMADESLLGYKEAEALIEGGCCNHFNLKISKLGGIFSSLRVYRLAEKNGIPCQLGAHFGETSLLTAAGLLLSGMAGALTAHEGAMGEFLLEKDIVIPAITFGPDGRLESRMAASKKGLGIIDGKILDQYGEKVDEVF